ncbi:PAQR family membrane homeostasis protein TrhA [Maribacter sp. HTCC2170]|uniref:PAQR family membrane homeostasis protein TrhA n=1 Tax=Maribacter sp. (strain HTCC2170 / KCCM 42371) TaxID=313603 RepID=UPI00006B4993|nr:hemolysin III family protein [Maribacter sp. HTCC2170]EAR00899.1 putative Hemolysin [Maribacter sp. HTCC2170]
MAHDDGSYHLEERLNTISHGIGAVLGVIGFMLLINADNHISAYSTQSIFIYSLCFIVLFVASTLYHATTKNNLKKKFRVLDHISIYFMIAGTYTPVALITLIDGNGWLIFYIVWGIAALGAVLKLFFTGRFEAISLVLYLAMGWLIVLDFSNLIDNTSTFGLQLLMAGGAFYTLGIVFYAWKRIPFNHFIWHLFVLGGAICHWLFIYYHVI